MSSTNNPLTPPSKNTNRKKWKGPATAIGVLAVGLVTASIVASLKNQSAEQKAEEMSNREKPAEVAVVGEEIGSGLKHETTGAERDKLDKAEEIRQNEARETGQSYIGIPNTGVQDGANPAAQNATLVAAPVEQPVLDAQPIAQAQPMQQPVIIQQAPPLVIPEQRVHIVTVRKEIPVARYEPYKFEKDLRVLQHFGSQYAGGMTTGQGGAGGAGGMMNMFGGQYQTKVFNAGGTGAGGASGSASGSGSASASGEVGSRRDVYHNLAQIQGNEDAVNYGVDNSGQGGVSANASANGNVKATAGGNGRNSGKASSTNKNANGVNLYKIGDVVAAELETHIDSRQPSLVRARLAEGPLQGAILVGTFTKNGDGTSVLIQFTSINVKGINHSIPVQAVAVDLYSGSNAMATSVNRHALARVSYTMVETMASAFATNLATNNQTSKTRTVTDANGNVTTMNENETTKKSNKDILKESGAAGISASITELNDLVPREPTVKVGPIPFGVFITQDLNISPDDASELGIDE